MRLFAGDCSVCKPASQRDGKFRWTNSRDTPPLHGSEVEHDLHATFSVWQIVLIEIEPQSRLTEGDSQLLRMRVYRYSVGNHAQQALRSASTCFHHSNFGVGGGDHHFLHFSLWQRSRSGIRFSDIELGSAAGWSFGLLMLK